MPLTPTMLFEKLKLLKKDTIHFSVMLGSICTFIGAEPVIRFYLDATKNMGHQANTIFVMRSIIDMTYYTGTVEIYVAENSEVTLEKQYNTLAYLIPGFDIQKGQENVCVYRTCSKIKFILKSSEANAAIYGFTGGADHDEYDYTKMLNVKFFLRLQPYFWNSSNEIQMSGPSKVSLPDIFNRMVYQYNMDSIKKIEEDVFKKYKYIPNGEDKMYFAEEIQKLAISSKIHLWPMYGFHQLPKNTVSFVLLLLAGAAIGAGVHKERPVVIPFFNKEECGQLALIEMLCSSTGEGDFSEKLYTWIKEIFYPEDPLGLFPKIEIKQSDETLFQKIGKKLAKDLFSTSIFLYKEGKLTEGIGNLKSLAPGIYLFQCGRMPMDIFNCLYGLADMPCIYEGQGTASLAINRGLPFLQLSINSIWKYSDLPVSDIYTEEWTNLAGSFTGLFYNTVMKYEDIFSSLVALLGEGKKKETLEYFQKLGTYMEDPMNDKLSCALICLGNFVDDVTKMESQTSVPDELVRLRNTMISGIKNGKLDMLEALKESHIGAKYRDLTEGSLTIAAVPEDIVLEGDGQDSVLKVTDKVLPFFGEDFSLSLCFRMQNRVLQSSISMTLQKPIDLPGVPWISFTKTGFTMCITEDAFPMQAAFCTQIPNLDASLFIDFPDEQSNWNLHSEFSPPMSVLTPFYKMIGGMDFLEQFPDCLKNLGSWGISSLQLLYNTKSSQLEQIKMEMSTAGFWTIPLTGEHYLKFKPVVTVSVCHPSDSKKREVRFTVSGTVQFDNANLLIQGSFPHFFIQAGLLSGKLSLTALLEAFGANIDLKTTVSAFSMLIAPEQNEYRLACAIETDWSLFGIVTIRELGLDIHLNSVRTVVMITGRTLLLPGIADLDINVRACYQKIGTKDSWEIEGIANCSNLFEKLFSVPLSLCELTVRFNTLKNERMFIASTKGKWELPFGALSAEAAVTILHSPTVVQGMLEANVSWENIHILVKGCYKRGESSFSLKWSGIEGKIEQKDGQWIGTLTLTESFSIGDLVETMVSWVIGYPFGLDAPWDIINQITLSGTSLSYNFTKKTVSLAQNFSGIDLGIASVKGIKLSYEEKENGKKGVLVSLIGTFPWIAQDAPGNAQELGPWDASEPGSAPVPNGSGNKYFDLTLLSLGQHVDIPGVSSAKDVPEAIKSMKALSKPEFGVMPDIQYRAENGWMIGIELNLVRLTGKDETGYMILAQFVFSDPQLYGLRVKLQGAASKVFSGLEFQILYRKLSDTLGVYESEIVLPDYIRHLSIGAYSLTLPVINIAVYTNGDFRFDLGFPWNQNFARSFTLEGMIGPIPFTGSMGLYFAKLSGETSTQVPKAEGGRFNPVIEFGLGIRFGVGKSLEMGPLKAGFSITVTGILEGVIAKWNPYAALQDESKSELQDTYFYKVSGLVGIVGNLFGCIDFCIVKASINIVLDVSVQFEIGSYMNTVFTVQAGILVEASLEVNLFLFSFKIGFSFSARIKETFVIENNGTAPWELPRSCKGVLDGTDRLSQHMQPLYEIGSAGLCWKHLKAPAAAERKKLDSYLAMADTIAADEWNQKEFVPCYVAMLMLDRNNAFSDFIKIMAYWLLAAAQNRDMTRNDCEQLIIDEATLQKIKEYLVSDDQNPLPVPLEEIQQFLRNQFILQVHTAAPEVKTSRETVYFPMLPELALIVKPYGEKLAGVHYTFGEYNQVSTRGIARIRQYFEKLAVQVQEESNDSAYMKTAKEQVFSMADLALCDYFLLVARQVVQAMLEQLRCYSYTLKEGESPRDILKWINENREVTSTPYTLFDLFSANEEKNLSPDKSLYITGDKGVVCYNTLQNDTLFLIMKKYNIEMEAITCHEENADIKELFQRKEKGVISIPHLQQMRSGQLLKNIDTDNIAGMVSRYSLHGMRFETEDIKPLSNGMWVSTEKRLPKMAGLHALTGQQFEIPDKFDQEAFSVSISKEGKDCPLVFCDLKPQEEQVTILIKPSDEEARRIEDLISWVRTGKAVLPSVDMTGKDLCVAKDVSYGLNVQTPVLSETPLNFSQGESDNRNLKLWNLPQSMIKLGKYSLQIVRYNESAGATTQTECRQYEWATRVDFKVKRTYQDCCYELFGSSETDIQSLKKLLSKPEEIYKQLILGYPEQAGQNTIKIDNQNRTAVFLTKANFSTDTNPGDVLMNQNAVQSSTTLIRRLWEALITNQGGFYLYYQMLQGQDMRGIPEEAFNDQGEAQLSLVIIYKEAQLPLATCILADEFLPDAQAGLVLKAESASVVPVQQETLVYQSSVPAGTMTLMCRRRNQSGTTSARERLIQGYSLLSYCIEESQDFLQSPLSLPVSGTSPTKQEFEYKLAIPYVSAAKAAANDNPYTCIGKTLRLQCFWQDYYGNRMENAQSSTILTGYTDSLIGVGNWPGIVASWNVDRDSTNILVLCLHFFFDMSRFAQKTEASRQAARNAVKVYRQLYAQLIDPNGIAFYLSSSLFGEADREIDRVALQEWLFTDENSVFAYLRECTEAAETPVLKADTCSMNFELPVSRLEDQQMLPLNCTLSIKRKEKLVMRGFERVQNIALASTAVLPHISREQNQQQDMAPLSLKEFAANFEHVFYKEGEYRYLLAAGAENALFAVKQSFRPEKGFCYHFGTKSPVVLVPRPFSNVLESRKDPVMVPKYVSGEGLFPEYAAPVMFCDIDMDQWIRVLLTAMDDILSPAYMGGIAVVDSRLGTAYLKNLADLKKSLADSISRLLIPAYSGESTPHLQMAREMMKQQMLCKMSDFYSIKAVLNYCVQTRADLKEKARMSGAIYCENQGDIQGLNLRPSKIDLRDDEQGAFFCLVSMPDIAKDREGGVLPSLTFKNLKFQGTHIEYAVESIPDTDGYESSRWLRFILEEHESAQLIQSLPDVDIPLILRNYPETPLLLDQYEDSEEIADSEPLENWIDWNYGLTYSRTVHYPQDSLEWVIRWNVQEDYYGIGSGENYFTALAGFTTLYPSMKADFDLYLRGMRSDAGEEQLKKAEKTLESFKALVQNAAEALAKDRELNVRNTWPEGVEFMTQEYMGSKKELVVRLIPHQPERWGQISIPVVEIDGYSTEQSSQDQEFLYRFRDAEGKLLSAVQGQKIQKRKICIPKLNVVACQNAKASVNLFRNRDLIRDRVIEEELIYRTGEIGFESPLYISRSVDQELNLAAYNEGRLDTINRHLTRFFDVLLSSKTDIPIQIQMECSYCYHTNLNNSDIEIPVFLQIPVSLMETEIGHMIRNWTDRIKEWCSEHSEIDGWTTGNFLKFTCILLTSMTQNPTELLKLSNLILPGEKILYEEE